jgi:hypothetical protein
MEENEDESGFVEHVARQEEGLARNASNAEVFILQIRRKHFRRLKIS